ncbi:hypothetical protein FDUTEX481_04175 [Tolypothrix sp. PCC 7601]|nr:hypothetical protein FDUTEX481_04175 [Tolypothrix sp. PCC 7601]
MPLAQFHYNYCEIILTKTSQRFFKSFSNKLSLLLDKTIRFSSEN